MQRIIVATDGSPGANRAIDTAARLAKEKRCELLILTIGGEISGAELRQIASTDGDLSKTLQKAADQVLGKARQRARRIGATTVTLQTGWGDPAETIIGAVRRGDILVVGRRGRGRLSGLLLGSVSQKLASLAPCVVMVVP